MATYALTEKAVVLRSEDDVAVAKAELPAGTILEDGARRIEVRQDIKPGHKVARRAVATGDPVRRYGQVIGFATQDIAVGDHVHTQNLGIGDLSTDRYEIGVDVHPVEFYPPAQMRTFDGYKREDGRVGTRNYVAVISGGQLLGEHQPVRQGPLPRRVEGLPERRRRARASRTSPAAAPSSSARTTWRSSACSPATPSTRTSPRTS